MGGDQNDCNSAAGTVYDERFFSIKVVSHGGIWNFGAATGAGADGLSSFDDSGVRVDSKGNS